MKNEYNPAVGGRHLNFELLRILSMFLIVLGHVNVHYLKGSDISGSITSSCLSYLYPFIIFHVNIFVIITGFFGVKHVDRSFLKVITTLFFYSTTIGLMLRLSGYDADFASMLLPLTHGGWWFIQIYLCMIVFAPLIEQYANSDRSGFLRFLLSLLAIDVYLSFIWHIDTMHNHGYDILHFLDIYSIGVFLRHHTPTIRRLSHVKLKCLLVLAMGGVIQYKLMGLGLSINIFDYNNPYAIIASVCIFCFFSTLSIPEIFRKIITFFSSSVLAVYIITEQSNVRSLLTGMFGRIIPQTAYSVRGIFLVFLICALVFVLCCLMDKARIYFFNLVSKTFHKT